LRASTTSRRLTSQSSAAISQLAPKHQRVVASSSVRWLVWPSPPHSGVPYRVETPLRPLFRDIPVHAVRTVGNGPKVVTHWLDSSHGVHRFAPSATYCPCVHSRPDRRPNFGPEPPRPGLVPFLPFLPASTVFSARVLIPKNEDFDSAQVYCTLQPLGGFATFPAPVQSLDCR
jgi:hypothetical protein